jgi:hypothetical protein
VIEMTLEPRRIEVVADFAEMIGRPGRVVELAPPGGFPRHQSVIGPRVVGLTDRPSLIERSALNGCLSQRGNASRKWRGYLRFRSRFGKKEVETMSVAFTRSSAANLGPQEMSLTTAM